jgi:hypothetical protein
MNRASLNDLRTPYQTVNGSNAMYRARLIAFFAFL